MRSFNVRNADEAMIQVLNALSSSGMESDSRNGRVLSFPDTIAVEYSHPMESVISIKGRGYHPFLMFFDGMFMFTSHNKSDFLEQFAPKFSNFANNGILLGDYGNRLKAWFGVDQIEGAVKKLSENWTDRRVVLHLSSPVPEIDVHEVVKDVPCNLLIVPRIVEHNGVKQMNITVMNRSNDLLWGMMGANIVQFSMLLSVLAGRVGVKVGRLTQISTNAHAYLDFGPYAKMSEIVFANRIAPAPITCYGPHDFSGVGALQRDMEEFMCMWSAGEGAQVSIDTFDSGYMRQVFAPMWSSWLHYQNGEKWHPKAMTDMFDVDSPMWKAAVGRFYKEKGMWT